MKKYLQINVIQPLLAQGFTGKYPHLRRKKENCIELIVLLQQFVDFICRDSIQSAAERVELDDLKVIVLSRKDRSLIKP